MKSQNLYKGWLVLLGLIIIYSVTNGVILNTLPLFYPELIKEFNWDQLKVTKPAQLMFVTVAIISPFAGSYLDKVNIKKIMLVGALLILIGFAIFSQTTSISIMSIAYFIFALGITLSGIIPSMKIITNWFFKNRGLAVGSLLVGSSIGGWIFNPISGYLMEEYGWKNALIALGLIATTFIFIPLFFMVNEKPEERDISEFDGFILQDLSNTSIGYGDIFKSTTFYLMLFVTGAMWFCIMGVIQHQSIFMKMVDSTKIASVIGTFFMFSIFGKVIFGKLSDRYSKKMIMLLAVCNLAIGSFILTMIKSNPDTLLWVYAVIYGIGFSGTFTMIQLLIANYYHGPSYGKILGLFTMIDTLAGVAGIITLGMMSKASGSYDSSFYLMFFLCIVSSVCVVFIPQKMNSK